MPESAPALILLGLALLFGAATIGVTFLLGPKRPTPEKLAPYECGIEEVEAPNKRFPVKYLVTGMLFIIFDVEAASVLPLAILMKRLQGLGFIELLVFALILVVPFIYIWRKGAFSWD
jgi:NADH-quinone oxidoreductase subunit A